MKSRSWPILALGFTFLIALIVVFGYGALRRAQTLYRETVAAHEAYLQTDSYLREIPEDMYLAGLLVRDYLLDPSPSSAALHRKQLLEIQSSLEDRVNTLGQKVEGAQSETLLQLRGEVQAYWDSLDPIFEWTPQQKAANGSTFLRQRVLPRSKAVMALAGEISRLNAANLQREQQRLDASQQRFRIFLRNMLGVSLGLGVVVAFLSVYRFFVLEQRTNRQREEIEQAERELRRLSRSLVQVQEDERKGISRDLHDAVGQMLTALGIELGNLASLRTSSAGQFQAHLEDAKRLTADTLRAVRDMAMGLRPSMLDDIGLGPALEWQGREFSRRGGVPVTVQLDGTLDHLPEGHRTCIYRIVQEALTNCAKHARAKNIRISLYGREDSVGVTIQDDGVGFATETAGQKGLGLLGIQERVRELEGRVTFVSFPNRGTILKAELPVRVKAIA
jgi:signal transduction histidine kinase